jgi:hypothetical protein
MNQQDFQNITKGEWTIHNPSWNATDTVWADKGNGVYMKICKAESPQYAEAIALLYNLTVGKGINPESVGDANEALAYLLAATRLNDKEMLERAQAKAEEALTAAKLV